MRCSTVADKNVLIVSFGFFFVFSGYNATQRFATTTDAKHGSITLGILYMTALVTDFIAAPIFKTFSPKITLVTSTLSYILFIGSNIKYNIVLLYVSAIFVGLSAPILWISKERLITDSSNYYEITNNLPLYSQIGYYNGIFWIIFLFHASLGSLFGAMVLESGFSTSVMYAVFTSLTIIGTVIFLFVKNMNTDSKIYDHKISNTSIEMDKNHKTNITKNNANISDEKQKLIENELMDLYGENRKCYWIIHMLRQVKKSILSVIDVWKEWKFQCLLIHTMYVGLLEGYIGADYPLLIKDDKLKLYILAYFGLISAVFSLIVGKLSDKLTHIPIIGMVFVLHTFYWVYLYFYIDQIMEQQSLITFVILSTVLAIGYSGTTQLVSVWPILLGKEPNVWQNMHIWKAIPLSTVFFVHSFITIKFKIVAYGLTLIVGCIPMLLFPSIRKSLRKIHVHQKNNLRLSDS
eukprot:323806_1